MSWAKVHWAVSCRKHGMEEKGGAGVRWVKVGMPKGKEHRKTGGCPFCRAEALKAAKAEQEQTT